MVADHVKTHNMVWSADQSAEIEVIKNCKYDHTDWGRLRSVTLTANTCLSSLLISIYLNLKIEKCLGIMYLVPSTFFLWKSILVLYNIMCIWIHFILTLSGLKMFHKVSSFHCGQKQFQKKQLPLLFHLSKCVKS